MKIYITAKPNKKKAYIEQVSTTEYIVAVKEPPRQNQANQAIIKALAAYFSLPQSQIILLSGQTARIKTFEVPNHLIDFEVLPQQKSLF